MTTFCQVILKKKKYIKKLLSSFKFVTTVIDKIFVLQLPHLLNKNVGELLGDKFFSNIHKLQNNIRNLCFKNGQHSTVIPLITKVTDWCLRLEPTQAI